MDLLIDIGNTRIKWAFWTPSRPLNPSAAVHKDTDLNKLLSETWEGIFQPPQTVYVSNVAGPTVAEILKKWIKRHWKVRVRFLVSETECAGIKNGYQKPETLGVDRWLAMIGARAHYSPPFCVMDCGSAITVDAVAGTGEHLGGLILPGLARLHTALQENCPYITFAKNPPFLSPPLKKGSQGGFFAKNTQSGISQGAFFMVTATLRQMLEELKQRFDISFTPIVTGGDALELLPFLPKEFQHRPYLVLEGIVRAMS